MITQYWGRKAAANAFRHHRKTWSREASFHLTRSRLGSVWQERLISALWLIGNRIPLDGVYDDRMSE